MDSRLREHERRWRETGSPTDGVAFLVERVRVSDLTEYRLQLAADCGHVIAQQALSALGIPSLRGSVEFSRWVHLPYDKGDRVERLRACLAVASIASEVAEDVAREAERQIGIKPADASGRKRLLSDLAKWVEEFGVGNVNALPSRRALRKDSPADQAVKMLREAVNAIRSTPIGNAPECALADALTNCAEVLEESRVKEIIAASALR